MTVLYICFFNLYVVVRVIDSNMCSFSVSSSSKKEEQKKRRNKLALRGICPEGIFYGSNVFFFCKSFPLSASASLPYPVPRRR